MIPSNTISEMAEQNAAMRQALDIIREHEFLRESLLARGIPVEAAPVKSMAAITEIVAARHSCTVRDLRGPCRMRSVVWARQEAMWLIRQVSSTNGLPRFSLPQIGRYFGDRDHTTALYSIKAHARRALAKQEAA